MHKYFNKKRFPVLKSSNKTLDFVHVNVALSLRTGSFVVKTSYMNSLSLKDRQVRKHKCERNLIKLEQYFDSMN